MAKTTYQALKEKATAAKTAPKASAAQKEQARKARAGARIARKKTTTTKKSKPAATTSKAPLSVPTANASELAGIGGVNFLAADYITGDIWTPNPAIPAIDEATYETQLTQAQGQSRSIEVASQNLKNINGLHKLEGQSVDIAISAKSNETRYAKLEGADIDYRTQVAVNGEKSERLLQATAKHESATRETGYTTELIGMKDDGFQLQIQQARHALNEKVARFQAQLTGN